MKNILIVLSVLLLCSCWKTRIFNYYPSLQKVWGSRPIYAAMDSAKEIKYSPGKKPIVQAGNIYAIGRFIYQVEVGKGIHVIDNTVPAQADRVGFIKVNGCAQITIKGNYIYTNSYADLVTIDITDPLKTKEVNRVANAFPEFLYNYPLAQPSENGYYTCPQYDSAVIGWVKDSIYPACYK